VTLPGIATISTSFQMPTNGEIYKQGSGTLVLNGSNSLAGVQMQINGGTVRFTNTNSFSSLGIVATANDGQLELQNAISGGTIFFGFGSSTARPEGVFYNSAGDNSWSGLWVLLSSAQSIGVAPQSSLTLSGQILDSTSGSVSLIKVGGGTFAAGTLVLSHALLINGGTFKTKEGGTRPSDIHGVTIAGGAAPTAKWDLTNNSAVVRSADQAALTADLAAGFAGGNWSGNGIASSTAQGDAVAHGGQPVSGVGMLRAQELPDWNGTTSHFQSLTLKAGDVALMYTHAGDTNLDGVVDLNIDFAHYLAALTSASPSDLVTPSDVTSGADWSDSDLNYDGIVDINNDFPLFVVGYDASGGSLDALRDAINNADSLPQTQMQTMLELVPEPSCAGIILLTITAVFVRRRRVA
jgi:autotransporter-associated beta strand protein